MNNECSATNCIFLSFIFNRFRDEVLVKKNMQAGARVASMVVGEGGKVAKSESCWWCWVGV